MPGKLTSVARRLRRRRHGAGGALKLSSSKAVISKRHQSIQTAALRRHPPFMMAQSGVSTFIKYGDIDRGGEKLKTQRRRRIVADIL